MPNLGRVNGVIYTPHLDEYDNLTWTNDGGLENPDTVNIRGASGKPGEPGPPGARGERGPSGDPGPNTWELAVEAGYGGTKSEFYDTLAHIELTRRKVYEVTAESTDDTYPSAAAVWKLYKKATNYDYITAWLYITAPVDSVVTVMFNGETVNTHASTGEAVEVTVHGRGEYTVSCTNGRYTAEDTVAVLKTWESASVELEYVIPVYTIIARAEPAVGGTVTGAGEYQDLTTVTLIATANDRYNFSEWKENGETVSKSASYTFEVTSDRTLTAVFAVIPMYIITAAVDPAGSGVVTGTGQYREGANVDLTATANEGYVFSAWQEQIDFEPETRLPIGYTELEYIEATGTQCIDTGVKPASASVKIIMDVAPTEGVSSTALYFFNSHYSASSKWYAIRMLWYANGVYGAMVSGESAVNSQVISSDRTPRRMLLQMDEVTKTASVDGDSISFSAAPSGGSMPNIFLLSAGTGSGFLPAKLYSCEIYDNNVLVRDFVPCKNASGEVGMYDLVAGDFYASEGSEAFLEPNGEGDDYTQVYYEPEYSFTAEKDRDLVASFREGKLVYHGTATALSTARYWMASATVGDYALFGGGITSSTTVRNTVDAYNSKLTMSTPTALGTAKYNLAAATVGGYALFGGGYTSSSSSTATVNAYNAELTRSTPTSVLSLARYSFAATTVGGYALFGGGYTGSARTNGVNAYDSSLTRTSPTALSVARNTHSATTIGNYALFGGGYTGSVSSVVDAYDTSLTRTTPQALSVAREYPSATSVGDFALFAGGDANTSSSSSYLTTVDAYDTKLTRSTPTALSSGRHHIGATSLVSFALFGGGQTSSKSSVVDVYNKALTRSTATSLTTARSYVSAEKIGNYALFAGGLATNASTVVNVYKIG